MISSQKTNGSTAQKVAVFGAAGQMGSIHAKNLLASGCTVTAVELKNAVINHPNIHIFDCTDDLGKLVNDGYEVCVTSIPETIAAGQAIRAMEAGFKKILLDKPGAKTSSDLIKVQKAAQKHEVQVFMNYQRALDPIFKQKLLDIQKLKAEGFNLDYVSVYSCDARQPPQAAPQPVNQACHDFAMLFNILEAGGDQLSPKSLKTIGLQWNTLSDTQFMVTTGQAEGLNKQKCLYEVKCGRVSSLGTFTEVLIKMSKFNASKNMYEPKEIKLKYPLQADPNAHWSDVWKDAFVATKDQLIKAEPKGLASLELGIQTLRMAELSLISLQQNSRQIDNITLTANQYPNKAKWITLDAGAGINGDCLVEGLSFLDSGHIVGAMQGYFPTATPESFTNRFPNHPAMAIRSMEELKELFGKDETLNFYYPSVPCKLRDDRTIEILKHFPNATVLCEKPSHATVKEAIEFKKALKDSGIDQNRVIIGMHNPLHPARQAIIKFLTENKDKYQIYAVEAYNHYPKDPTNPRDARIYDKRFGGVMRDLGLYVLQQADEISRIEGFEISEVLAKGDNDINIKYGKNGADIEALLNLNYQGVHFSLSSKLNPGTDTLEEYTIWLIPAGSNEDNLSKITFAKACHPGWSWTGAFLEHADGTVEKLPNSLNQKTSYSYQLEMCQNMSKTLASGYRPKHSSEYLTLDYQIYILSAIEQTLNYNKSKFSGLEMRATTKKLTSMKTNAKLNKMAKL